MRFRLGNGPSCICSLSPVHVKSDHCVTPPNPLLRLHMLAAVRALLQRVEKFKLVMSDAGQDGDISSVNPSLLKLCSNAEEWKQQRREALLRRVFGKGGTGAQPLAEAHTADAFMPQGESSGSTVPSVGDEAFVLQQVMSLKRRRDDASGPAHDHPEPAASRGEAVAAQQQPETRQNPPPPSKPLSTKELLMRKFGAS